MQSIQTIAPKSKPRKSDSDVLNAKGPVLCRTIP
jgi:hypothetical protein